MYSITKTPPTGEGEVNITPDFPGFRCFPYQFPKKKIGLRIKWQEIADFHRSITSGSVNTTPDKMQFYFYG